ncbi:hypothetical protein NLJ89_g8515 [Agrocybe chaxingu]|uniref:DUF6534 domain-containing protein n=1 Tax=Agrocybe chaxingu TaxID=84603 RepID=A0A9W8MS34_9AGAR|nr:hypothetical protein NLJ89_g8515 [Agrocybe chaxingu]
MAAPSPFSLLGPAEFAHGWMFIGFLINAFLLGLMTAQVYIYYSTYKRDRPWIKIFVAVLYVADIFNTIVIFAYLYRSLITFFGDEPNLGKSDWLFAAEPASTGVIAMMVQLFFAWRAYSLTKSVINGCAIAALAITGGVSSIVTGFEVGRSATFVEFDAFRHTVILWLVASVVCDILITLTLVTFLEEKLFWVHPTLVSHRFLEQQKHKTGFQRSDLMIDRIIRVVVQTGLLTMIVATVDLIVYLVDPSGTHLMINYPLAKLYSNSLMSSLNSRKGWKFGDTSNTESEQVITGGTLKHRNIQIATMKASVIRWDTDARTTHPEVFVHVESHELRDVKATNDSLTYMDAKASTLGSE